MTTALTTTTDAAGVAAAATRLQLLWLASPALPVGGYSYSEGLEAAVESGLVRDESQAAGWLAAQLQLTLARAELPALATACAAWQRGDTPQATAVNDWLRMTRESAELRAQSEQMGRSLVDWLRNGIHAGDPRIDELAALKPAPTWPVAWALAAALASAAPADALLAYAWGWAENMAQAAIKAVPLGQGAAQRLLARLAAAIPAAVESALALPASRWQAQAPMLAILSARHESQYSRLFRS